VNEALLATSASSVKPTTTKSGSWLFMAVGIASLRALHGWRRARTWCEIASPYEPDIAMVIPSQGSSMLPNDLSTDASHADVRVHTVATLGGLGWQDVTSDGRRSLVETTMGCCKALIRPRLYARDDAEPHRSGGRCGRAEQRARARTPGSVRTRFHVS
jgi:hypothetical protein